MAAITRLSSSGYGTRRAGSFTGKTSDSGAGPHPVSRITRLGAWGHGTRRNGSFSNKASPVPTPTPDVELLGGGGYVHPYTRYREEEYQREQLARQREELRKIEQEISEAEQRKRDELAALAVKTAKRKAKNAARKLAALEAQLQEEINRLRMERAWLIRLIDDEEAILVLLLSMPFH